MIHVKCSGFMNVDIEMLKYKSFNKLLFITSLDISSKYSSSIYLNTTVYLWNKILTWEILTVGFLEGILLDIYAIISEEKAFLKVKQHWKI